MLKGKHILSSGQFSKEEVLALCERAAEMEKGAGDGLLAGKIMASLFFEPSTRTRFSFEAAMQRLGGMVISNADMKATSSAVKSETLWDTGKVVSQMADVIVMRHPREGAVAELAEGSDVPVLNGGDGAGDHPTQSLLDVYTIWKEFDRLDGLRIGVMGDLKHSRVLRGQCEILSLFDVDLVLISPEGLGLGDDVRGKLGRFEEVDSLAEAVGELDVISVNRIQEERFGSKEEAESFRGQFVVTPEILAEAKESAIVICPLPRREELPVEVDSDPRARYFEQVANGVAMRMALLASVVI